MRNLFKILTFILLFTGFVIAKDNAMSSNRSFVNVKINQYYFDVGDDSDSLYKKRSHKRRKIKRKPRRGRDNR